MTAKSMRGFPKSIINRLVADVRHLSTAATASRFPIAKQYDCELRKTHHSFEMVDLSFNNYQEAFKSKTNFELLRANFVLKICSYDFIVKNQQAIFSAAERLLGRKFLERLLQLSFYGQFVSGKDVEESKALIEKNWKYGVKTILNYTVEEDINHGKTDEPSHTKASPLERTALTNSRSPIQNFVNDDNSYDYAHKHNYDIHMNNFLYCIDSVAKTTKSSGFSAIKVTALGNPEVLKNVSEIITRTEEFFYTLCGSRDCSRNLKIGEFQLGLRKSGVVVTGEDSVKWFNFIDEARTGKIGVFQWCNVLNENLSKIVMLPSLKKYVDHESAVPLVPIMEPANWRHLMNITGRLEKIADRAKRQRVRIFIDAEQSYIQTAINHLVVQMMRRYNKNNAVIFNTYQAYTKISLDRLKHDMDLCAREDLHFACKLVRGAYINQERARAYDLNLEDPIWSTPNETSNNYLRLLRKILSSAKLRPNGKVSVMCATHNEESVRNIVSIMKEQQISPDEKVVCFGQLLGMSDQISFTLGQAGFSVYKCLHYGPTFEVVPYLMRRAQENRGIFDKVLKERNLLKYELMRRLRTGEFFSFS